MKSPSAPDPYKTAAAQSATNTDTAITQQLLNMTNQVTPGGALTYNQSGSATYTGADGKTHNVPTFTGTQTLSPNQQTLYNQNEQADLKQNDIALGQIDRIGGVLNTPFNYDSTAHEAWAGDLYGKLNNDTNQRNVGLMDQKLANQGLQPGTPAYDDAMRNLTYGQEKGRNDFLLSSYDQGMNSALTNRNQPLNEVASLMSGTAVQQPNYVSTPQTGVQSTDLTSLVNNAATQKQSQYNAGLGGIFGAAGTALGGWASNGFALSDKRAKKNISEVGKLKDGTKLYSYEYKPEVGGKGLMHIGVMAGEAKKTHPSAVMRGGDGYLRVNYGRIAEELAS